MFSTAQRSHNTILKNKRGFITSRLKLTNEAMRKFCEEFCTNLCSTSEGVINPAVRLYCWAYILWPEKSIEVQHIQISSVKMSGEIPITVSEINTHHMACKFWKPPRLFCSKIWQCLSPLLLLKHTGATWHHFQWTSQRIMREKQHYWSTLAFTNSRERHAHISDQCS